MATLHTLVVDDPTAPIGGALITYPSGYRQQLTWRAPDRPSAAHADAREVGKHLATQALDGLMRRGAAGREDSDRTNWPSMAAGLAAVYRGWGERGRPQIAGGGLGGVGPLATPTTESEN